MALEYEKNLIYRYLVSIGLFGCAAVFMINFKPIISLLFLFFSATEFYMVFEETRGDKNAGE